MSAAWAAVELGDLCEILDSRRVPITKKDRVPGPYPYYGATGILGHVASYIFDEPLILIGEDGAKWGAGDGSAFAVAGPCWVNNHAHVIRPLRDKVLDTWLVYYLNYADLSPHVSGLTVPKLNQGNLRGIHIPVAPMQEQARVVAFLDETLAAIAKARANTEENVGNARSFFDNYRDDVVTEHGDGWVDGVLSEFVQEISTGPFGSLLHKSDYQRGGLPLVNPINIEGDKIVPDARKAVGNETAQRLVRYALREGDVVIARRGEIGRCAVVTFEQAGWLCGTGCFVVRPSDRTDSHFIAHLLRSRPYRGRLEGLSARATMPSISNDDLAALRVGLPPVAQQRRISALLGELSVQAEHLSSVFARKLAALDALKQSLLHEAFTGAL